MVLRQWLSNVSWHANAEETFDAATPWMVEQPQFFLGSKIGEGAFGVIYRGTLRGETVAAKMLKDHVLIQRRYSDKCADAEKDWCAIQAYNDLVSELAILVALGKHPNVVEFRGACLEDKLNPIIFEEFVGGPSLSSFFHKRSCKPEPWVPPRSVTYQWSKDLVKGLVFLHNRSPAVMDLKPGNLLLTKDLQHLKITDFGMSKMVRQRGGANVGHGNSGTIAYMAPEVFHKDRTRYTDKVDIYGAAVIIWYIASGMGRQLHYRGEDSEWRPDLSWVEWEELRPIIGAAWAANPESRPSATDLLARLEGVSEVPPPMSKADLGGHHCCTM